MPDKNYKDFKSLYHLDGVRRTGTRPLTRRETAIAGIMSLRENVRKGIPLPPSPLFENRGTRHLLPEMGEKPLGPWKGALQSESLSFELIGQCGVGGKRMTEDQVKEALKILASVEASAERSIPVSERASTAAATTTQTKPVVQVLEKELRHKFDAEKAVIIDIADHCWNKMQCWIGMTTKEISGLGCVKQTKGGRFLVYDVFLFEQENTYTFTDIDDIAVQKLMVELDEMDEKDGGTRFQDLKFWWHSHGDLEVTWSAQDDHNIEKKLFGDNTDGKPVCPWWLSIVLNKKGKINTRLDIAQPWMTLERVSYRVKNTVSKELVAFCKAEYDKKVREPKTAYQTGTAATGITRGGAYATDYEDEMYGGDFDWENWRKGRETNGNQRPLETTGYTATPSADQEAYITTPTGGKGLFRATSLQAYRHWEEEIISGMMLLYQLCLDQGFKATEIGGLAFRPTKIPGITCRRTWDVDAKAHVDVDDQYEWIIFGNVKNGDYLLTVWPGSNAMHLGRIVTISEVSGGKRVVVTRRDHYNERYERMGLGTHPTWIYATPEDECVVGIILTGVPITSTIPYDQLGDIFFNDDVIKQDLDSGPAAETAGEKAEVEGQWGANDDEWDAQTAAQEEKKPDKDTATQDAADDQAEQEIEAEVDARTMEEEGDLYTEMLLFAGASHKSDICRRVYGWLTKMDRETVIDFIAAMEEELKGDELPEHSLSSIVASCMDDEVVELAMNMVRDAHEEAFAEAFMLITCKAYCPSCYEPLHEAVAQCPNCKMHVIMN